MRAIRLATGVLLFFSSSVMMSHLGINPERGGSPPRDRSTVAIRGIMMGCLFHAMEMELIVVYEDVISIRNIEMVIRM